MELMPGYKRSDVGVIPDDWDCLRACEFGFFKGGSGFPLWAQGQRTGEYPFFKVSDMNNEGNETFMTAANHYVSEQTRKHLGAQAFPADSIVFAKVGAAVFLERKKILGQPSCIDNNMAAYVLDASRADVRFVHSLLLMKKLGALVATTALPALNGKQLAEMVLALPPLPEQRVIAAALSDVDALLATLDQVIAKKRDLKQAAMQQLLTGKIRLPGFGGEWEAKKLEHAGCCLRGVSYRGDDDLSPHDTAFTKRLLRSNNVQNAFVVTDDVQFVNNKRVSQDQVLQKNDILICMANGSKALVGKAGLFSIDDGFDYTFGAFMGCFRTDASIADPVFVFSLFQTGRYRDYINNLLAGSSINNLSPSSIDSLEFSFPPYAEQVAIGRALAEMDAELSVLEYRRDKTHNLKQAMMQELLTGKTRLVEGGYDG